MFESYTELIMGSIDYLVELLEKNQLCRKAPPSIFPIFQSNLNELTFQ